ncbi:MAG: helix-turn-helix domain-containing protein [Flavobacteriaceae bacterium]|jgi:hypothetical protein|nr:helix-turn-helix domain-containing protein [Flavobacteriaceae bacterium]
MDNQITKGDLKLFSQTIVTELKEFFSQKSSEASLEWVKAKVARQLLSISAASLQTLRVSGKLRYKKVLGSYYYNRTDIDNLFNK